MKNKIILEIGQNHLGSEKLLFKYLKIFNLKEVHGFTMQLRDSNFYKGKNKKLILDSNAILKFKKLCKLNKKKFGISIQNEENLKIIDVVKPDFIKVLSYTTQNLNFCSELRNKYKIPIYYSLGLIKKNKSSLFLKKFFKRVSYKNTYIIYTKIEKLIFDFSLKEFIKINKNLKNKIAYGHHFNSIYFPAIFRLFNINTVFLYIKDTKNIKYPDNDNAFNIDEFKKYLKFTKLINKVNK